MTGRVALSGGIASGKNAVCHCFTELAVPVIDADQIARELLRPRGAAYHRVIGQFGSAVVNGRTRQLRRTVLRHIISTNAKRRRQLTALLHPLIRTEMARAYQAVKTTSGYCIFCIPLLVETGMHEGFDRILMVDARRGRQLRRLMTRDRCNSRAASRMLAMQSSRQSRLRVADDIIDNDGTLEALRQQVFALHQGYQQLGTQAMTTGH